MEIKWNVKSEYSQEKLEYVIKITGEYNGEVKNIILLEEEYLSAKNFLKVDLIEDRKLKLIQYFVKKYHIDEQSNKTVS